MFKTEQSRKSITPILYACLGSGIPWEGRSVLVDLPSASELRRWAMQCSAQATSTRTNGDERDRLLKMRDALLDLAEADDWLQGRPEHPGAAKQAQG